MSNIFCLMMIASVVYALMCGNVSPTAGALLAAGSEAVNLAITLTGAMALWCGLMEVLRRAGDVQRLGSLLRRVLKPLFPGMEDEAAWGYMASNLAANMMGLGNAATPAGIAAAKRLNMLGETGLRALAMLLVLNNSSLQWLPTTVITLRAEAGSTAPAGIWLPAMMVSGVSTAVAAGLMMLLQRRDIKRERRSGLHHHGDSGRDCATGHDGAGGYV